MNIKEQIENYEQLMMKGHLSKEGLMYYISLLKGHVIDWENKLNKLTEKEMLTKSDLKDIEKNKAKYGK